MFLRETIFPFSLCLQSRLQPAAYRAMTEVSMETDWGGSIVELIRMRVKYLKSEDRVRKEHYRYREDTVHNTHPKPMQAAAKG